MALRRILTVEDGEAQLRRVARPVMVFNWRLEQLIDDLFETLRACGGVGLAAPQVGVLRRVAVIECDERSIELVNPEILETSGEMECEEACLSIPGKVGRTRRPQHVKVRAYNRKGEDFVVEGDDMLALALVHETGHLDGHLYTDYLVGELLEVPQ